MMTIIIKHWFRLFLSIFFLSFLTFCNIGILPIQKSETDNARLALLAYAFYIGYGNCSGGQDLWARNIQTQTSYCVPVEIVSDQAKVIVYKQRGLIVNYNLEAFGREFNDQTYPKLITAFGEPSDIDKNGKIKILVLDIIDGALPNAGYVAGFFDPVNYSADSSNSSVRSNFGEVLYLDGRELIASLASDPKGFSSTAAHEFQHLIRYPYMAAAKVNDDLWINEGTSEVASDIAGYGPQKNRLDCFRGLDTNRCPNGANGISMLNWSNQTVSSTILKQYAMAYAYMRYLYDISGSNETEKNTFFRKTVQGGNTGIRASTTGTLMTILRESARYNNSQLGSTDPESFFRTYMLFFGQATGLTNFAAVDRFDVNKALETIDISSAYASFPFESSLSDLITNPLKEVSSSSLSFSTGSSFVLNGNNNLTTLITGSSKYQNMGTVKNSGSTKTLLGWGAYSNSSPLTSTRNLDSDTNISTSRDRYKSLITGDKNSEGSLPICGALFIDDSPHND